MFTANMTGNTVLLALALAQGDAEAGVRSLIAVAGFVLGGLVAAAIVYRRSSHAQWPAAVTATLGLECLVLLALGSVQVYLRDSLHGFVGLVSIVLSGTAMGMQSVAARRLDVSGVTTTYITGTITSLLRGLVAREAEKTGARESEARGGHGAALDARLLAAVWLVYFLGAMAGGLLTRRVGLLALGLPLALIVLVIIGALSRLQRA